MLSVHERDRALDRRQTKFRVALSRSTYPADLGGKVNSNTKGRNIDEVCEHLHNSVKPKKPAKAEQSNADSSKWEEDDKGQRCKDTMCDLSALGLFKVTAEGD